MSFPYTPNLQDEKIESLQTQQEYLNLLRLRQLNWMSSTSDPEIKRIHRKLAETIEQTTDQYNRLLKELRKQREAE
jgi:hypothetical protein